MKREGAAALLLLTLLAAAALNTRQVDRLVSALEERVTLSEEAAAQGDYEEAAAQLDAGIAYWQERGSYTGSFLRHGDLDAAFERLYELKGLLAEENAPALGPAYEGLRHQLEHLAEMEHLSIGTVF